MPKRNVVRFSRLFSIEQIATCTQRSARDVRRDVAGGELRTLRVGLRIHRVPRKEARRYLAQLANGNLSQLRPYLRALHTQTVFYEVPATAILKPIKVAQILNVSDQHVHNLLRARAITFVGKPWFVGIQTADLLEFLNKAYD